MRRIITVSAGAAVVAAMLVAGATLAAKPSTGCPSTASEDNRDRVYFIVDVDEWWVNTVDGFEAEGIPVYVGGGYSGEFTAQFDAFAADLGFGDGAGLEFFVKVTQWAEIDKNDNGLVCMKDRPITRGNPAYFFNGVDDQASTKHG